MRECVEEERENPGLGGRWAVLSVGGDYYGLVRKL